MTGFGKRTWFEVTVGDVLGLHVLESADDARAVELRRGHREAAHLRSGHEVGVLVDVCPELTA